MKTVLVTGGIGSGKSLVCSRLSSAGVAVYDSDSRTKALYDSSPALVERISEALGQDLSGPGGALDRGRLSEIIFSDPSALATVESIVHPAVLEDFLSWKASVDRDSFPADVYGGVPFVVLESAIALDKPLFAPVIDKVVLVEASRRIRLARLRKGRGMSSGAALARMEAQSCDPARADALIVNDGSRAELFSRVDAVFASLWDSGGPSGN